METPTLSPIALQVRICPRRGQWPKAQSSPVWAAVHDCIYAYKNVVQDVEYSCLEVEANKDLRPDAIRRRRAEICDRALARLADFRPLEEAETVLSERISALESLDARNPEQVRMLGLLKQALGDLREGLGATRRTVLEICKVRVGVPV